MTQTNRLSPFLVGSALTVVAAGIASGALEYSRRSHTAVHESPGTAAWPAHLALTAVLICFAAIGLLVARRRGESPAALFTAPLRRRAGQRLRATAGTSRMIPAGLLTLLFGYALWRAGEQVTAGFDPHFRSNAWGGPSYIGAMYCHSIDGTLICGLTALLLSLVLLRPAETGRAALRRNRAHWVHASR